MMQYKCDVSRHKYISSGYPCEGWMMRLSAWKDEKQDSLNTLAKAGDQLIVSTAEWLSEMYGEVDDPPEAFFTEESWSSIEIDADNLSAMTEDLERRGWIVTWRDANEGFKAEN